MGNLRKAVVGTQHSWTKEELKAGFAHFKELYKRYPTAHEIDAFPYLPSARSIQRTFGGLVNLRKELFPEEISDYTRGTHRSKMAKRTYQNGRDLELRFYEYLTNIFEEISVHEHKVIRPGDVNCDFYIYLNSNEGIIIDIFYADSILNLINVVNLKLKRYALVIPETYLVVVGNAAITQQLINTKAQNRKIPLPPHVTVVSTEYFDKGIIPSLKLRSEYSKK